MRQVRWIALWMTLLAFGRTYGRPQTFDPESEIEGRHLHRSHHQRRQGLFGAGPFGQFGASREPFGPNLGAGSNTPFGGGNQFGGGPFGSPNGGGFSSPFGGGPAAGMGMANAGNGATANGIGIAQPSPGGFGLGMGIGLAMSTPFGNIGLSDGESFAMGK